MARVRAPELVVSGGWRNVAAPPTLAALRGRVALLDFWTAGCLNCLHVAGELHALERRFGDDLVVIGVHSPKFAHERDPDAVGRAVARLGIAHPVADDADGRLWDRYAVRAWPTLVLLDHTGRIALTVAGEGNGPRLAAAVEDLLAEADAAGARVRGRADWLAPGAGVPPMPDTGVRLPAALATVRLRLPGGAVRDVLAVADAGGHRVVVRDAAGRDVAVAGAGVPGDADGPLSDAGLRNPQGLCDDGAGRLLVADAGNHLVRRIDLAAGAVTTVAGSGRQGHPKAHGGGARSADLDAPWALARWGGGVAIAMAGGHRIWLLDEAAGTVSPVAGTGDEHLVDGPAGEAMFAQPSGLAAAGDRLYVADAESSALRLLRDGAVRTLVGRGLFVWGHADGPAGDALLQHPSGLAQDPAGGVLIADAYNGAVRRYDPVAGVVTTLARDLVEPTGVAVTPDGAVWACGAGGVVRLPAGG